MKKAIYLLCSILALSWACTKDQEAGSFRFDEEELVIAPEKGSIRFVLRSNTLWELECDQDWISLNIPKGAKGASVVMTYDENASETEPRSATITGRTQDGDASALLRIVQMPQRPVLQLAVREYVASYEAGAGSVSYTTSVSGTVTCETEYLTDGDGWLGGVSASDGTLSFTLTENTTSFTRRAKIRVSATDTFDRTVKDSVTVVQSLNMNPDAARSESFGFALAHATGPVQENFYVSGQIVLDGKNPNFPALRYTLQSTDGEVIIFTSGSDLEVERGQRVKLWLLGTEKDSFEESGVTYPVYTGITAQHIMDKEAATDIPVKAIAIRDLDDSMLYSLVTLKDVDLAVPFGSVVNFDEWIVYGCINYINDNRTYDNLTHWYGTSVEDRNGDALYMLNNFTVPYRETSLPKGSGDLTGVIVRETSTNFGDIGRYSIRPLAWEDIALAKDRADSFRKVLVEWTFDKPSDFTEGTKGMAPSTGPATALFTKNNATGIYNANATGHVYFGYDYRGDNANAAHSANRMTSALYCANWDTETWWLAEGISTVGITGQLTLQVEANSYREAGPAEFVVEYSLDGGTSWNSFQGAGYILRGQSETAYRTPIYMPGFKVYSFKLPAALNNQPSVQIRLRCSSTLLTNGSDTGTIAGGATSRIAHFSIKYVK